MSSVVLSRRSGVAAAGGAAAVVAALALTGVGGTAAAAPGAPSAAAATTTLTAVVRADGGLARGSGAISSAKVGALTTSNYEVVFDRNLLNCVSIATIGGVTTDVPPAGTISVTGRGGNANAVFVSIRNPDGVALTRPFHVAVHC